MEVLLNYRVGGLVAARARIPSRSVVGRPTRISSVSFNLFAMGTESEWDKVVAMHGLFHPHWSETIPGTKLSLVVDCEMYTGEMMVGLSIPDNKKVRIFGDVSGKSRVADV